MDFRLSRKSGISTRDIAVRPPKIRGRWNTREVILALPVCATILLGGCQNPQGAALSPVVSEPALQIVEVNQNSGGSFIKSKQPNSLIAVQQLPNSQFSNLGTIFDLKARSMSQEEIVFGPASIQVRQGQREFPVIGFEVASAKVKSRENAKQALNMFAMVLGGVAAGMGASSGGIGGTAAVASFPITAVAATNNIQRSSADLASFDAESSQVFLANNVPLAPKSQMAGLFAVEGLQPNVPIEITITLGTDVHKVVFQPAQAR